MQTFAQLNGGFWDYLYGLFKQLYSLYCINFTAATRF